MASTATFFFNLVWSVMGANWLQDKGLGDDTWFQAAAITTCIFSFLSSWGILVSIFLGLIACCCALAFISNQVTQLDKDLENLENQGDNTMSEKMSAENQQKIEKLKKTLSKLISYMPIGQEKLQSMTDKHTDKLTKTNKEAPNQDEENKPLNEDTVETIAKPNGDLKKEEKL